MLKTEEIIEQIQKKHPKLSLEEQSLLAQIVVNMKDGDPKILAQAKKELLNIIEMDLNYFFSWEAYQEKRDTLRFKFLNIAGLYNVVPHAELLSMLHRVYFKIKRPISDVLPANIFEKHVEIDAVALKHLSPFAEFLALCDKVVGITYLDFISGNRALGIAPVINFIVFEPNVAQMTSEEKYLSASSETFTKTIYLSTFNHNGSKRDYIGMAYDLITQSAFIDFFHNTEKDFNINKVLRNSMIIGTRFVENMMHWFEANISNSQHYKLFVQLSGEEETLEIENFMDDYIHYLETDLMDHNLNLVSQLNEKLGLAKDDYKIHL